MIAAGQQRQASQQAYQQGEQERRARPLAQPQGAQAVQPNAQPQTFATLQQQGYARPARPPQQPQAPQQGVAMAGYDQARQGAAQPQQQAVSGQQAQYGGGMASQQASAQQPQWQQQRDAYEAQMSQNANGGGDMTSGQGMNESMPQGQGQYGGVKPVQYGSGPANGFNGAAPNYNPLDYMVGQMMQPGQETNFGGQQAQFQNYTPTQAPQFQGAGTNFGQGAGQISVQGGGGGVDSSYQANDLNPYAKGQFTNNGGPVADAAQQKMLDIMQKPSGWDSNLVQNMYGSMGAKVDDQFNAQDTSINEEMAKRGLYDSSIAGGRLKDSNLMRRDAKTNLADSLLQQMGMNYGNDQARAATLGAGYQGQQFGENTTGFGLNQGAESQAFGQRQAQEAARQGAFGMNQQGQMANSQAGIAGMQANLQAQTQNQQNQFNYANLNSQNTLANNSQQLDRSRFMSGENQFGVNTANQNAQQAWQNRFQGGQQDFNNRITNQNQARDMNGQIINYGQQQFNNDMTQQQFNRQLSNDQWQQLMDSMGLR